MPQTIVDRFQIIEIQQKQGKRLARPSGAAHLLLEVLEEFPIIGESRQTIVAGTKSYFVLGLPAFRDVQRHSDAPDDFSLGVAVRPDAQIVQAIAARVFEPRGDSMEREKMLFGGCFAIILAPQILVDGLPDRIMRKAPCQARRASPM